MGSDEKPVVAILGGTGPEGRGLAVRWSAAGYRVIIGSRDEARAREAAAEVARLLEGRSGATEPSGADNRSAAAAAAVVVLAVPYAAQAETIDAAIEALSGKVVIDVAVPLRPPRVSVAQPPPAGSAAAEAQAQLGPGTPVVAAFQNVAASKLQDPDADAACDVLVCGDDAVAKDVVLTLAADAGLRAYDAGPLQNAAVVDGLTAILIGINRRYGSRSAGVRVTNVPGPNDL